MTWWMVLICTVCWCLGYIACGILCANKYSSLEEYDPEPITGPREEAPEQEQETVTKTIETVCDLVCTTLCKYPIIWDSEKDGDLWESDHCKNCPLNRLN